MHPLPEGRSECGICGYPANGENAPLYLQLGTVLSERYLVGRMMESVGDAAVYIGYDKVLKSPIQIREFLPDTLCERKPDGEIGIISGCEKTYRDYLEKFLNHARALARMRDVASIVSVYDIFNQNNTAYTISEFCEGITLEARLKQVGGRIHWDEARPLLMTLMASLISLHSAGIYHLGICPETLILGTDGKLRLQDFSIAEARQGSTDLRPKLAAGYSAPEQYGFGKEIGTWTDVYGLAATIFRTLTGNHPPEGCKRAKDSNDLYVPANIANELPDYVAAALFNALQANPENRTKKIQEFRDQLSTAPAVSALLEDDRPEAKEAAVPVKQEPKGGKKKSKNTKVVVLITVTIFFILLVFIGIILMLMFPDLFKGKNGLESSDSSSMITTTGTITTTKKADTANQFEVDNVVGKSYYDVRDTTFNGKMKIQVQYKQYSNKPKGEILSQTPSAGSLAAEGTPIQIVISGGPQNTTVPDVKGWNVNQAKPYLEALGFRVQVTTIVSTTVNKDIVESVDAAGKSLPEGSTVTLRVSGSTLTTVAPSTAQDNTQQ